MSAARVSVVIPTQRRPGPLATAVRSIIRQEGLYSFFCRKWERAMAMEMWQHWKWE